MGKFFKLLIIAFISNQSVSLFGSVRESYSYESKNPAYQILIDVKQNSTSAFIRWRPYEKIYKRRWPNIDPGYFKIKLAGHLLLVSEESNGGTVSILPQEHTFAHFYDANTHQAVVDCLEPSKVYAVQVVYMLGDKNSGLCDMWPQSIAEDVTLEGLLGTVFPSKTFISGRMKKPNKEVREEIVRASLTGEYIVLEGEVCNRAVKPYALYSKQIGEQQTHMLKIGDYTYRLKRQISDSSFKFFSVSTCKYRGIAKVGVGSDGEYELEFAYTFGFPVWDGHKTREWN
jgi:hypothetical protein